MSDLVVPNIFCFQTQKQLPTLNNIRVLLKSVLIDYVQVISCTRKPLRARCVHARHLARDLSSPDLVSIFLLLLDKNYIATIKITKKLFFKKGHAFCR